jgi:hypothetical protein
MLRENFRRSEVYLKPSGGRLEDRTYSKVRE